MMHCPLQFHHGTSLSTINMVGRAVLLFVRGSHNLLVSSKLLYSNIYTLLTSVTAYPILNDALKTGELDYINGGTSLRSFTPALVRTVF